MKQGYERALSFQVCEFEVTFSQGPDPRAPEIPSARAPEPEKVRALFDQLSSRYDQFNRCASLGLDLGWRKTLVRSVMRAGVEPKVILDLGTGTADLICDLAQGQRSPSGSLIGIDISELMLKQAYRKWNNLRKKVAAKQEAAFIQANIAEVPLVSGSVDVVVSAFTLRNIKKVLSQALSEVRRILRPGGRIFFLEMYVPNGRVMRGLHQIYLKTVLGHIGRAVFGKSWPGNYLAETIQGFGTPSQFSDLLERSNFREVQFVSLTGGIAALHSATK